MAAYAARTSGSRRRQYSCPGAWRWRSGAGPRAVRIGGVEAGGPAASAGLQEGDMLLSLDGTAVTGTDDLTRLLGAERIGRETLVSFLRDRQAPTNFAAGRRAQSLKPQKRRSPAADRSLVFGAKRTFARLARQPKHQRG